MVVLILRGGIVEYSQSVTIQKKFKNLIEIYFLIKISYFFYLTQEIKKIYIKRLS
jgi:hypothetical protein